MATTVERFYVSHPERETVHFEQNGDLTIQLNRGGQLDARNAERGIVLVYLGVDDQHSQVVLQPWAGRSDVEILTEASERITTARDELRRLDG